MSNLLEYKGFLTKVYYSHEDAVFYGKLEGIDGLVTFECSNVRDIKKEFHSAVDDYIQIRSKFEANCDC